MTNRAKAEQLTEFVKVDGLKITMRQVSKAKQKRGRLYAALQDIKSEPEVNGDEGVKLVNRALGIINAGE